MKSSRNTSSTEVWTQPASRQEASSSLWSPEEAQAVQESIKFKSHLVNPKTALPSSREEDVGSKSPGSSSPVTLFVTSSYDPARIGVFVSISQKPNKIQGKSTNCVNWKSHLPLGYPARGRAAKSFHPPFPF